MQFNSLSYILGFLPLVLALHFLLSRRERNSRASRALLVVASLVFYGWWHPPNVALLLGSILANYFLGRRLTVTRSNKFLALGILLNLGTLGYFKYAGAFVGQIAALTHWDVSLGTVVLPLAISFFTFQQLTYLVDAWKGECSEYDFLDYSLFVTFFPQLIAGPIVHHREMMPQFDSSEVSSRARNGSVGVTIFLFGLCKKVIGDSVGGFGDAVFNAADAGVMITGWEAWLGTISFALQVYFDFSGYSDMAIGAARMFGVRLPTNFDSPYKASNPADFWRRWHMTLTRLVYEYVHTPIALAMARRLAFKKSGWIQRTFLGTAFPLIVTFVLVGVWHGAGWTFILFGVVHAALVTQYALWRLLLRWWRKSRGSKGARTPSRALTALSCLATFLAVAASMVLFRAENLPAAQEIYGAMLGLNGFPLPARLAPLIGPLAQILESVGIEFGEARFVKMRALALLPILLAGVWLLPNTQQIMANELPTLESAEPAGPAKWWQWQPTFPWAVVVATLGVLALMGLTSVRRFVYFQF